MNDRSVYKVRFSLDEISVVINALRSYSKSFDISELELIVFIANLISYLESVPVSYV